MNIPQSDLQSQSHLPNHTLFLCHTKYQPVTIRSNVGFGVSAKDSNEWAGREVGINPATFRSEVNYSSSAPPICIINKHTILYMKSHYYYYRENVCYITWKTIILMLKYVTVRQKLHKNRFQSVLVIVWSTVYIFSTLLLSSECFTNSMLNSICHINHEYKSVWMFPQGYVLVILFYFYIHPLLCWWYSTLSIS